MFSTTVVNQKDLRNQSQNIVPLVLTCYCVALASGSNESGTFQTVKQKNQMCMPSKMRHEFPVRPFLLLFLQQSWHCQWINAVLRGSERMQMSKMRTSFIKKRSFPIIALLVKSDIGRKYQSSLHLNQGDEEYMLHRDKYCLEDGCREMGFVYKCEFITKSFMTFFRSRWRSVSWLTVPLSGLVTIWTLHPEKTD